MLPLCLRRWVSLAAPCIVGSIPLARAAAQAVADTTSPAAAHRDSVSIAPGLRVPASQLGASVVIIDSAEIAASGARTLSELLTARVPGLSVRRRGGLEAEGADLLMRGGSTLLESAPMLVIDGVLASSLDVAVPGTSASLSRLDDFTPADVQRIEVLRGPAAGALYGIGAAAGVIALTTRRGASEPLRASASAGVGLTRTAADFPANYQLTSGAPYASCNPRIFPGQAGTCTPTTLYSWNPLKQASPFRSGPSGMGSASLEGSAAGTQLFAGASVERDGGVTRDDWQSRFALRSSVARALPGGVKVSAQASYRERRASVPERGAGPGAILPDDPYQRGLLGSAYDDSLRGYRTWAGMSTTSALPEPAEIRATAALQLEWQPSAWISFVALGGRDRASQSAVRTDLTTGTTTSALKWVEEGSDRWRSGTMHLGSTARFHAAPSLELATTLAYEDVRWRTDRMTCEGFQGSSHGGAAGCGGTYFSLRKSVVRAREQALSLHQRASWGDALALNAGTRWSVGRGIAAPFGLLSARSVGISWRIPELWRPLELRARAAAGVVPLDAQLPAQAEVFYPYQPYPGSFPGSMPPLLSRRPRRGERELGLDAVFAKRVTLELSHVSAVVRDEVLGLGTTPTPYGVFDRLMFADVRYHGVEGTATARLRESERLRWDASLIVATGRDRVLGSSGAWPLSGGHSMHAVWASPITWTDANGDGQLTYDEVTAESRTDIGSAQPTLEMGLRSAVSIARRLTLSGLLDYRSGQHRLNLVEAMRCYMRVCRGLQDSSAPLAEQAAAFGGSYLSPIAEGASFLRLRELVAEWRTAARFAGSDVWTLRVVGQNLATWTRYRGFDPETGYRTDARSGAITDVFQSPLPRRLFVELRTATALGR